jgi:hypothetical protein
MEQIELDGSVPISISRENEKPQDDKPAISSQELQDPGFETDDFEPHDFPNSSEIPDFSEPPISPGHDERDKSQELTPYEKQEKNKLIRKIGQYKAVFSEELAELDLRNLYLKSLPELIDLSELVEFHVSTRRSIKSAHNVFLGGLTVMELFAPRVGFDLKGLTNVAANSQDLLDTVSECSIKYSQNIQIDPIHRLGIHVMQLALAVDSHNKAKKAQENPDNRDESNNKTSHISEIPNTSKSESCDESRKISQEKITELSEGL